MKRRFIMSKTHKILSLVLVLCMAVGLLAGCGGKRGGAAPAAQATSGNYTTRCVAVPTHIVWRQGVYFGGVRS